MSTPSTAEQQPDAAAFSPEDPPPDTPMIRRSGLIFTAGDYPDKAISLTDADLAEAVSAFTGAVPAELEHTNTQGLATILDGKMGRLERIWAEGSRLYGEMAVPEWLDPLWAEHGRKVSAVWDRATKRLTRIGLVLNPRVADAAVMSAYAAFAGRRHSMADQAAMQQIHDLAADQGADCTAMNAVMAHDAPHGAERNTRMSLMANLKQWYGAGRETRELARQAGADVPDEAAFSVIAAEADDARKAAHEETLARMQAQLDAATAKNTAAQEALFAATAQRLAGEAAAFADGLIAGNKLLPAEREGLIATLTQAGMDDAQHGVVTFSGGNQGSRVELLKATYAARPAHTLTAEQLKVGTDGVAVFNGTSTPDPNDPDRILSEEEKRKLLTLTVAGRTALKGGN